MKWNEAYEIRHFFFILTWLDISPKDILVYDWIMSWRSLPPMTSVVLNTNLNKEIIYDRHNSKNVEEH